MKWRNAILIESRRSAGPVYTEVGGKWANFFFGYVGTFTYWLGSSVCDDEEDWASIIFY